MPRFDIQTRCDGGGDDVMAREIENRNAGMRSRNIAKQIEAPAFNESFFTMENMKWFNKVLSWSPCAGKPVVFLPCGSAAKTRTRFGKKMISQGLGHQFMSAVTREPGFECIILSEPLTLIPYALEGLHPDYNLPPGALSIQSEQVFIDRLALYLARLKITQPARVHVYYLGSTHHYFILHYANLTAGSPFRILHAVPRRGLVDYAAAAKQFKETILATEQTGVAPFQQPVNMAPLLDAREGYTHRGFWKEIVKMRFDGNGFSTESEGVTATGDWEAGFKVLYQTRESILHAINKVI